MTLSGMGMGQTDLHLLSEVSFPTGWPELVLGRKPRDRNELRAGRVRNAVGGLPLVQGLGVGLP